MLTTVTAGRGGVSAFAVVLATCLSGTVAAQTEVYPSKIVRTLNSLTAGSSADNFNRIFADALSPRLNQRVIVENRPGDGGNMAAMAVVKAPPDGYTLLMGSTASLAIQMTYSGARLEYDLLRSLAPVSKLAEIPNGIFVTPVLPVDNLKAFVAYVKAKPGQYSCASGGVGGLLHLTCELFKKSAGISDILHVPYKGTTGFRPDLVEGRVTMTFDNIPVYVPLVQSGKLKIFAVTTAQRAAILPYVPTSAEAGMPGLISRGLFSLLAPLNTPPDVIALLSRETIAVLRDPKVRETLLKQGIEPAGSTPQDLRVQLENEVSMWAKVFKEANIPRE